MYIKKQLRIDGHYFIYIPLKDQLKEMVNSKLYLQMREECRESDVINGRVYKNLRGKGIIKDNDITLQINVDGINLCKSSHKSLWAVIVGVNELPHRLRKNNPLLVTMWYGEKKTKYEYVSQTSYRGIN